MKFCQNVCHELSGKFTFTTVIISPFPSSHSEPRKRETSQKTRTTPSKAKIKLVCKSQTNFETTKSPCLSGTTEKVLKTFSLVFDTLVTLKNDFCSPAGDNILSCLFLIAQAVQTSDVLFSLAINSAEGELFDKPDLSDFNIG